MADQADGQQGRHPFDESTPAAHNIQPWLQSLIPDAIPLEETDANRHDTSLSSSPSAATLQEGKQRQRHLHARRHRARLHDASDSQPVERLAQRMRCQSLVQQPSKNDPASSDPAQALGEAIYFSRRRKLEASCELTSPRPAHGIPDRNVATSCTNEPTAIDHDEMDVEDIIRGGLVKEGIPKGPLDKDTNSTLFTFLPFRRSADAAARCPIVVRNRPQMRRRHRRKVEGYPRGNGTPG